MASRAAFLAYPLAGDEVIESYWTCASCDGFVVERYRDRFLGDAVVDVGWVSTAEAAPRVARFLECPAPTEKRCRCPTHQEVGG